MDLLFYFSFEVVRRNFLKKLHARLRRRSRNGCSSGDANELLVIDFIFDDSGAWRQSAALVVPHQRYVPAFTEETVVSL